MGDLETSPLKFGHGMLSSFGFAPGYVNLNCGSYGAMPLPVLEGAVAALRKSQERADSLRVTFRAHVDDARERIAKLIKAETDECVLVTNVTHGVSTVLFNIDWKEGDVIVGFNTNFFSAALQATADRSPQVTLKVIPIVYPFRHADLLERFRKELQSIPRHEGQKILAVMDGISSQPGVRMPWEAFCKICKEEKVLSLVDGAHLLGQVDVDLASVQPDFLTANCHKWLYTKMPSGVLYVPKRNQHYIKFTVPISTGYVSPHKKPSSGGNEFVKLFEYTGSLDHLSQLTIAPALDFRESIGGQEKMNAYCHALAIQGGKRLAEILGTRVLDNTETGELTANMTNVLLPWPAPDPALSGSLDLNSTRELTRTLLEDYNCMAHVYVLQGGWWARCSAQIWNELSDFEYLGKVILEMGAEMRKSENQGAAAA